MLFPESIKDVEQLEKLLCIPNPALVDIMRRLKGDIMILGVAGKMGVTMAMLAVNAIREAGVALVPGSCFGCEGFLRLSYCCAMEALETGLSRLEAFLQTL